MEQIINDVEPGQLDMTDFSNIWPVLVEKASELDFVTTFGRENRNDIRYDERRNAISFNSRATDEEYWTEIPRDKWKMAWERFQETGELSPDQFFDITGIRRGSIAVPFLQKALELPGKSDDRVIYLPEEGSELKDKMRSQFSEVTLYQN